MIDDMGKRYVGDGLDVVFSGYFSGGDRDFHSGFHAGDGRIWRAGNSRAPDAERDAEGNFWTAVTPKARSPANSTLKCAKIWADPSQERMFYSGL
uniref:ORF94 n=1 Tax=Leptospirillum ferrooxidans TaxID=180 RepID=Q58KD9_9BACT|nr:ORF94 [Leptospirillum ferrooxidans]